MKSKLDHILDYYASMWYPRCNVRAFQREMEDSFKLDCNPEDLQEFPEAKKLYKYIIRSGKHVNKIVKLCRRVMQDY